MFAPLKTRVRLRPRIRWDDDDDCGCPPEHEPLWQQMLVAPTPVGLTAVLELWIDRRKRERDAERASAAEPEKPARKRPVAR